MLNTTFLKACRGEKTDYTPAWIMRQAGRYLPEYRKIREKVDFLTLCKTPELAAEVTVQPVDILNVDAAILFSDILIPIEPMGMKLEFLEDKGPVIHNPVRNEQAIKTLKPLNPAEDVPFVAEAVKLLVKQLNVPLIGFSGAPFTLATYMIEGGSSRNFVNTKSMMYRDPALFHTLMDKLTTMVINYLKAQLEAGVHAVQIFDSWAGALSPQDFRDFELPYVKKIIAELDTDAPVIYFPNNGAGLLRIAKESGADVISVDWRIGIGDAAEIIGKGMSVQGNLDPVALFGPKATIREQVASILQGAVSARGHIFNLGHGILPETPVDNVITMVEAVHELSSNKI
jgi:uroporphyrinogen decarboxylase